MYAEDGNSSRSLLQQGVVDGQYVVQLFKWIKQHLLYQILQILSITLFEKTPILQAFQALDSRDDLVNCGNQLNLFDF